MVSRFFRRPALSAAILLSICACALPACASGEGGRSPTVTLEPVSKTVKAGTLVAFRATAGGSPTPTVQWQVMAPGAGSFTPIPSADKDKYTLTAASADNGNEYRAVFSNIVNGVVAIATTNAAKLSVAPAAQQLFGWSGYADTGGPFSSVSGTWAVPTVTCPERSSTDSSEWVGIDGFSLSSLSVEQDGTRADCLSGSPNYYAWYQMHGDHAFHNGDEVELSPSTYPVDPRDVMTGSVSVSGSIWTLSIDDTTRGWSYSTQVSFSGGAEASAEWVVERPTVCLTAGDCPYTPLADFGSVRFSNASVSTPTTSGTISSYPDDPIEMTNYLYSRVLALPGPLDPAGDGFTDTWKAAG